MAGNKNLGAAKTAKKDEFYTQLSDIENELKHYRHHFEGKTVLCNCDDPYESNFSKFFFMHFNDWGLKKLICTCYSGSPITATQLDLFEEKLPKGEKSKVAYKLVLTEVKDWNEDGAVDIEDVRVFLVKHKPERLKGTGDFASEECIELLKEADIVVTNPPFSLFRKYIALLVEYDKQFLIIGNKNAITFKEIFPLIKENRLWTGYRGFAGGMWFSAEYEGRTEKYIDGKKLINVPSIWFTNLDHNKRHEPLDLFKHYTPEEYPKYDNCDAIEVAHTSEIPCDYDGVMGVPISFLDKYCPEQFEIVNLTKTFLGFANKKYPEQIQVDKDGKESVVTKLNDGPVFEIHTPPAGKTYYKVGGKMYIQIYARILIRKKHDKL